MIRMLTATALVLLAACHKSGNEVAARPGTSAPSATVADSTSDTAAIDTTLPPMPDYPQAHDGKLAIHSVGDLELDGTLPAHAGRCRQPAMVEVLAQDPLNGVLILLAVADSGPVAGTYPITFAAEGTPTPPAAQVAIQRLDSHQGAASYQALAGSVEVTGFGKQMSGRLKITVRDLGTEAQSHYAAVFQGLTVQDLDAAWCARAIQADSAAIDSGARKP